MHRKFSKSDIHQLALIASMLAGIGLRVQAQTVTSRSSGPATTRETPSGLQTTCTSASLQRIATDLGGITVAEIPNGPKPLQCEVKSRMGASFIDFTAPPVRTMPLPNFPEMAHYSGRRDVKDAANWSCPQSDTSMLKVGESGRQAGVLQ